MDGAWSVVIGLRGNDFREMPRSPIYLAPFDLLPIKDVYRHRKRIARRDSFHRTNEVHDPEQ